PSISRQHAVLHLSKVRSVEDLGSTNGTRVSGVRLVVGQRHPVSVGMVIEIGGATTLLQRSRMAPRSSPSSRERAQSPGRKAAPVDPTMQRLYALVDVIAPTELAVLILGETGVGKELFAEELHRRSKR